MRNLDNIVIFGDKVLVKPLEKLSHTVIVQEPDPVANEGKDLLSEEAVMHDVEHTVYEDIQPAIILKVGADNRLPVKVGDTVYYHIKTGIPFTVIQDSILLKNYDLIGLYDGEIETEAILASINNEA